MEQKIDKIFSFLDNCVCIGSRSFPQFQREYLPSVVNVVTNTPKILHITKRDTFQISFPQSERKDDKIALMQIPQVFGTLFHVDYQMVFSKRAFSTVV